MNMIKVASLPNISKKRGKVEFIRYLSTNAMPNMKHEKGKASIIIVIIKRKLFAGCKLYMLGSLIVIKIHVAATIFHIVDRGVGVGVGHGLVPVTFGGCVVVWKDIKAAIAQDDASKLAIFDAAAENEDGKAVEGFALDETRQGVGTVGGGVSRGAEIFFDFLCALDINIVAVALDVFLNFT